ncbi:C40 family peptidase [Bacillus sp. NTK071]|uniref:C40 family peptidase n=1 Tax=Bacillus sp. NTK071 TaxID=2802175 RepID=UPI001A8C9889|nr:NlpC/P60 family protein [Bacillus sp. NTK071]MBN8209837.1 C40 family peptidase [Bacillus sp. NTK071]
MVKHPINYIFYYFVLATIFMFATSQSFASAEGQVGDTIVHEANKYIDAPFKSGGDSPEGFNGSGFVNYVLKNGADIYLPRYLSQQWEFGTPIERNELQPGDVLFFSNTYKEGISHNGIYLGDEQFIHVTSSSGVTIDSLIDSAYWESKYTEARRYNEMSLSEIENPVVKTALSLIDSPYKSGGETPKGFNSPGFVDYAYKNGNGTYIPELREYQWEAGEEVAEGDLQPGDAVFFSDTYKPGISHNGIYIGNDQFIHVTTSSGVTVDFIQGDDYYRSKFTGAKRYTNVMPRPENSFAKQAIKLLGTPYERGGDSKEGLNSSGFIEYAFKEEGVIVPGLTEQQWETGEEISKENLQPGDVVFFSNTYKQGISHNGIYLGNDQFAHVTTSEGVTISYLDKNNYYSSKYTGAKRYDNVTPEPSNSVAKEAMSLIGAPYKRGGESPSGFNHSGLIEYVFKTGANIIVPRLRDDQWAAGEEVAKENLKPGDVIFFSDTYKPGLSHNGVYVGNDQFVHALSSSGVTIDYLSKNSYYSSKYTGARRYDDLTPKPTNEVAKEAISLIGAPYQKGGDSPEGFNGSGFIDYVYKSGGDIVIPRLLDDQWSAGEKVAKEDLEPGDVVFFQDTYKPGISHNGIYVGDDQFVHVTTSTGVTIDYLDKNDYYSSKYAGARRYHSVQSAKLANNPISDKAIELLGSPYESGGESPSGFNSTGFIEYVFQNAADIVVPRLRDDQWVAGEEVAKENLKPGDVVFFQDTYKPGISHNGIYVGSDRFVHVTTSSGVTMDYLDGSSYYSSKYAGARRYNDLKPTAENAITKEALSHFGAPYESGGELPSGFNSSGYIQYVFQTVLETVIPRTTDNQWETGEAVAEGDLQPGDVVFFSNTYKEGISHNGIYLGDDQFIHVTTSGGVVIDYINKSSYYSDKYTGARRFDGLKVVAKNAITEEALSLVGTPYESGGTTPSGFNNSGFVHYVFDSVDIPVPNYTEEQSEVGETITLENLKPGDVVFFENTYKEGISHNGIYLGNDKFVHATSSDGVTIEYLTKSDYYSSRFVFAKRYTGLKLPLDIPLVATAASYLGVPYENGTTRTPEYFDCSSFIQHVFKEQYGIFLPGTSAEQWEFGQPVEKQDLQVGDIVFFSDTYKPGISHNGIYIGNGQIIHANGQDDEVSVAYLDHNAYYSPKYTGARRYDTTSAAEKASGDDIILEAKKHMGIPYTEDGTTPDGFDASGFVQYVFSQNDVVIPRYGFQQIEIGTPVSKEDLKPGDLVFFEGSYIHPGIYIGNDEFIHVSHSSGVDIRNLLKDSYYAPKFKEARRVIE